MSKVFCGVDWSSTEHVIAAFGPDGKERWSGVVPHSRDGLEHLKGRVMALAGGVPADASIALELQRGPVVATLIAAGHRVLYAPPSAVDAMRDIEGAGKDDLRDARVMALGQLTHPHRFHELGAEEPWEMALRQTSRSYARMMRQELADQSRLREVLQATWPEALDIVPGADEPWLWRLLVRAPRREDACRLKLAEVELELGRSQVDRGRVMAALGAKRLLDVPTPRAVVAELRDLCGTLLMLRPRRRRTAALIGEAVAACPSPAAPTLLSWPGCGPIVAAALLVEARWAVEAGDYLRLRKIAGVAPVLAQTGKSRSKTRAQSRRVAKLVAKRDRRGVPGMTGLVQAPPAQTYLPGMSLVRRRRESRNRLGTAMLWCAGNAVRDEEKAGALYRALRARGHGHNRALRGVVDRLLLRLCAAIRAGEVYREELGRAEHAG